jgi:hypothetical protein
MRRASRVLAWRWAPLPILLSTAAAGASCGGQSLSLGNNGSSGAEGGGSGGDEDGGGTSSTGAGAGSGSASGDDGGAASGRVSDLYGPDLGAGPVALRRITLGEYNRAVRDLLGDTSAPATVAVLTTDFHNDSFFSEGATVSDADANGLISLAEALAARAVSNLPALLPGVPLPTTVADQLAWATQFIAKFGRRAYRRPLLAEEQADLLALYQAALVPPISADFAGGIGLILTAILQSPSFLYRRELGPNPPLVQMTSVGPLVRYTPYELASRLSYLIWDTIPDEALLDAAQASKLSSVAQVQAQARRMLADPKAVDGMVEFVTQWLGLDELDSITKDPSLYPQFGPNMVASMHGETRLFVGGVLGPQGDGRLATLLTSPSTFIDTTLAELYGYPPGAGYAAPPGASAIPGFGPVMLDPSQRAGLLTEAAFLAVNADYDQQSPPNMGTSILGRVLCAPLPAPPVTITLPPVTTTMYPTQRARWEAHGALTCAQPCHKIIDPLGFAFLNYDAIGRWSSLDNGHPIDASGSMTFAKQPVPTYSPSTLGPFALSFANAIDLVKQLAHRPEVEDCVTDMWLRYLERRDECPSPMATPGCVGAGDTASLDAIRRALRSSSGDLREMLVALTVTNAFTTRVPSAGEMLQ